MSGFKWIFLVLILSSCSKLPGFMTGGGPNVAANIQAGAENHQTLGVSNNIAPSIVRPKARTVEASTGETGVRAEEVQTVVVEAAPDWFWVLAFGMTIGVIIGWTIETPYNMIFGRKNGNN